MSRSADYFRENKAILRVAFIVIVVVSCLTFIWLYAQKTQYLLCEVDCGETALAVNAADGFRSYGFRYWLLENLGNSASPQIYTHNVNLGGLLFIFLDVIGVREFEAKQIAVLCVFGLSLLYSFLLVQLVSRSFLPAAIMLVLMSSTYWVVTAFALNALRAWHFVALFGVGYHLSHCLRTESLPFPKIHLFGFALSACVAFGCGYDFWVICGAFALTLTMFRAIRFRNRKIQAYCLALVVFCFALPFFIRQLQVMGALGFEYWVRDFLFSVGIKIPGAAKFIHLPPIAEIDAFYQSHHVFRPPAVPSNSFLQILYTMTAMIESVSIPRWGILSLLVMTFAFGFGFYFVSTQRRNPVSMEATPVDLVVDLLLPLLIAIAVGLLIFAPFSLHVYLKHEFPLIAAPILLSKAIAIWWLIRLYMSGQILRRTVAVVAILLFIFDFWMLQHRANNNGIASNLRWVPFVSKHLDSKFLFSTYYVSVKGLTPENYRYIAPPDREGAGKLVRDIREGGAQSPSEDFSKYDYWIHQPLDRYYFMDTPSPTCDWSDWLASTLLVPLSWGRHKLDQPWIDNPRVGPGSVVFFGGTLPRALRNAKLELEIQGDGNSPPLTNLNPGFKGVKVELRYNCVYRTLVGRMDLGNRRAGDMRFNLISVLPSGKRDILHQYTISIDARVRRVDRSDAFVPPLPPQITTSELASIFPSDAIVESDNNGIGYVIVDLRKIREKKH